ncbi:MAG: ABC transporter permease [Actinobacteria bacterium]|nr:ABC transporter permease [Actinomycetota bacterium]
MLKKLVGASVPLLAAVTAFFFGAIMLVALGANPFEGFQAMLEGAFGSGERIATTAVRATPLILVGAGISIAFRARVINIGGESQIIAGALLSTVLALNAPDLPAILLVPLVLATGAVGGFLAGAVPGLLKAHAHVNEILSTIMLNLIMVQFMNYLLGGPLIDPLQTSAGTFIPQTERLSDNAALPTLVSGTRLHLGVPVAVLAAVAAFVLLWKTPLGFRLRAVGHNADAAKAAGINVKRHITYALAISGSFGGLAGSILVFGSEGQRMVTDGSAAGFTGSAGFNGIVAALFGGLHPLWTIPSAFLFGALLTGAVQLQRVLQVPASLAVTINGIVVLFVISSAKLRGYIEGRIADRVTESEEPPDDPGPLADVAIGSLDDPIQNPIDSSDGVV